jgi:hypothetical protein
MPYLPAQPYLRPPPNNVLLTAGSWSWWSFFFAVAIGLELFGFQLIGAFADSIGMETPRPLSLTLRFGMALILIVLLLQIRLHVKNNPAGTAFRIGLGFLLFYGLHLVLKSQYPKVPLRLDWFEYLGYFILFDFIPFFAAAFACREKVFDQLFVVLTLITTAITVVYLSVYGVDAIRGMRYQPFESVNPIALGYTGLATATLAAWRLLTKKTMSGYRLVFVPIMLGGLTLTLLSGERQVFLSLVVTTILFLHRLPGKSGLEKAAGRIIFCLSVGLLALIVFHTDMFNDTLERVQGLAERVKGGREKRLDAWAETILIFVHQPIIGGPIELPSDGSYPHNIILEAFMVTGIIGGPLFLLFFVTMARLAFRVYRFSSFGWIALLHYQVAISALFSGALYFTNWYWTTAGLVISAYRLADIRKCNERTKQDQNDPTQARRRLYVIPVTRASRIP